MTSMKFSSGHFHYIMMEEHTNYMSLQTIHNFTFRQIFKNRLSVSCSMLIHTRNEISFCFSDLFYTTTRISNSINSVISLLMRDFIFYITVKRNFFCVINNNKFNINAQATSYLLEKTFD